MGKSSKKKKKSSKRSHRLKTRHTISKEDPNDPNPSSVTQKICDFMSTEKALSFSDVTIVSSDGVRFPALRALLVIRSPYFDKLFSSDFAEKNSSDVRISLGAEPLHHVLNFVYTDNCPLVRNVCSGRSSVMGCRLTSDVINLALAADYVEVQKLLQWCMDALRYEMARTTHSLCLILQTLNFGTTWAAELKEEALKWLTNFPDGALLGCCNACDISAGVLSFTDIILEEVFSRISSKQEDMEGILFQVLLVWTNGGHGLKDNWSECLLRKPPIFVNTGQMEMNHLPRLAGAKRIAKMFDLTKFSAKTLVDVVETSGLCTTDAILDAYRALALKGENCANHHHQARYSERELSETYEGEVLEEDGFEEDEFEEDNFDENDEEDSDDDSVEYV